MKKIFFLICILALSSLVQASSSHLKKYQAMNDKVFINIGADWCLPCKFYKKKIFETQAFKKYAEAEKVLYVELDYADDDAKAILKDYKRSGIPFYLYLNKSQPKVVNRATDWREMFANIKSVIQTSQ